MTDPINLTQLRARVELYEDNLALKDTLLALITAVEAARNVYDEIGGIGDRANGCGECPPTVDAQERLHEALTRFTT